MNAELRCFSVVVLLLALMRSDSAAEPPDPAENEAVAALEKMGGSVNRIHGRVSRVGLFRTKVTDDGLVHLKGLANLRSLDLRDTKVSDDGLVHLKALTKLEFLFIPGTTISDTGLEHLKGLTMLWYLELNHTKVTDAGLVHVKRLTNLK